MSCPVVVVMPGSETVLAKAGKMMLCASYSTESVRATTELLRSNVNTKKMPQRGVCVFVDTCMLCKPTPHLPCRYRLIPLIGPNYARRKVIVAPTVPRDW